MQCTKISPEFQCQGQRSKSPGTKTRLALPTPMGAYEWYALAANNVQQQRTGPFRGCQGVFSGACVCNIGARGCDPAPVLRRWENQRMLSSCCESPTYSRFSVGNYVARMNLFGNFVGQ